MAEQDHFLSNLDPDLKDIGYDAVGMLALRNQVRAHGGVSGIFNILRKGDDEALRALQRYGFLLEMVKPRGDEAGDTTQIRQEEETEVPATHQDNPSIHPAVQEKVDQLADAHNLDPLDAKLLFIAAQVYHTAFPEEFHPAAPGMP